MLGLAAGGAIEQKVYPDPYGVETWDVENSSSIRLMLLDEAGFRELKGTNLPDSPSQPPTTSGSASPGSSYGIN
ncbi:MAG: hypothetical protein WKF37_22065 [Bryobacteraceae bacterium]